MEGDFPYICFCSYVTQSGTKKLMRIFDNYGTWEALNVEKIDNEFVVIPRNLRNIKSLTISEESIFNTCKVMKPIHGMLFLNHPYAVAKLYPETRLIDVYFRQALKKRRGNALVTNNVKKRNSLASFHPDVTHGTMLKEVADQYTLSCNNEVECELDSLFKQVPPVANDDGVNASTENFLKKAERKIYFNSSMLDADSKVLDPIIIEDNRQNAIKCVGNRQYAGSCLAFVKLNIGDEATEKGILACPYDDLGLMLAVRLLTLSTDLRGRIAKLHSELRVPVPQGIYQIQMKECFDNDNEYVCIATRSIKSIKIMHLHVEDITWDVNEQKLQFVNENVIKTISTIKCEETLLHFCLSPMIDNECTFSTESGRVCLCRWSTSTTSTGTEDNSYEVITTRTIDNSNETTIMTAFCDTPRSIYVSDKKTVDLFNIRTKQSTNIFHIKETGIEYDYIWSIENGINRNEIFILTNYKIHLVDYRQPLRPLLNWCMNTTFPSLYMSCALIQTASSNDESYVTFSIASPASQEVLCFQYRNLAVDMKKYAPQSCGSPYSMDKFMDTYAYEKMEVKKAVDDNYLQTRLQSHLRGVKVIHLNNSTAEMPLVVVISLNAVGDLGYQTVYLAEDEPSEDTTSSFGFERREMENNQRWSKAALSEVKPPTTPPETMGIKCKLPSHFFDRIMDQYENKSRNKHPNCSWCNNIADEDLPSVTEKDRDEICALCGFDVYTTRNLGKTMHPGKRDGSNVWTDSDPKDIPPLNLIDLDQEKGSEVAKLLKGTWSNSYEDYCQVLSQREDERKEQERLDSLDIQSQN